MAVLVGIFVVILSRIIDLSNCTETFKTFKGFPTNICKKLVFATNSYGIPTLTVSQDGYFPTGIYYSCLCLVCITILINIQHLLTIRFIVKIKPKNVNIYQNNNCSKSSPRPSTTQNQEIQKQNIKNRDHLGTINENISLKMTFLLFLLVKNSFKFVNKNKLGIVELID